MAESFVFHVRNAHPGDMVVALTVLEAYPDIPKLNDIVLQAERMGFTIRDRQRLEALVTARDLGLVERSTYRLTQAGLLMLQLETHKPDLFADLVHGLQYALWSSQQPDANCSSWTYRSVCQWLWQQGRFMMDSRREVASEIASEARRTFDQGNIALSSKSIGGVFLWLKDLRPPVLDPSGSKFTCRPFCPPELFLMAVDYIYQTEGVDYGVNLLLSEARRDTICQMCLLESSGFERVLQYAVSQFGILDKGIGGGWGYYLVLGRPIQLEDLCK